MNKREQQRRERRQQILNCSLDMLISRGYEATKIRDIADKLHISTGLFFNYFESKEKVYEELVKIGLSAPSGLMQLYDSQLTPIGFFEKITAAIFDSIKTNSMTAKMFLLMSQTIKTETAPESVRKLVSRFDAVTQVLPLLRQGQALGEIRAGDPAALAVAYWGAVQGVAESYAIYPELPFPESDWIVDILRA